MSLVFSAIAGSRYRHPKLNTVQSLVLFFVRSHGLQSAGTIWRMI